MLATKDLCSLSNGSACNSKSYSPSYVLLAMGIPEEDTVSSIRVSWGSDIDFEYLSKSFIKMITIAKAMK